MQDTAQATGLRRPTKTALLEIPSSGLRLARGRTPPRAGSAPFEGQLPPRVVPPRSRGNSPHEWSRPARGLTPPSSGSRPARGSVPPSAGARHAHGRPARVRRSRTRAFNALTPQDGAIMRPGLAPRCRRTNSPGRSPSPPLWGWTVRYGRCQSRDTARPLQYG
jgi:hypothetical protein